MTKCLVLALSPSLLAVGALGACAQGRGDPAMTAIGPGAVFGHVVDADDEPVADVSVQVGDAIAVSDSGGRFEFADAPARYDAAMVPAQTREAYVYQGLSTRSPTLRLAGLHLSTRRHTATIHATGAMEGRRVVLLAQPLDGKASHLEMETKEASPSDAPGVVDAELGWVGDAAAQFRLYALEVALDDATGAPARYTGIARVEGRPEGIGRNAMALDFPLRFEPIDQTTTITARVRAPRGLTVDGGAVSLKIGDDGASAWLGDRLPLRPDGVSVLVPNLEGLKVDLFAIGSTGAGSSSIKRGDLSPRAGDVELELSQPPALESPADRARDVTTSTEFRWSAFVGGVHWLRLEPIDRSGGAPTFDIATADTTAKLPDLAQLGAPLPARTAYRWYVIGAIGARNVDDAAADGFLSRADGPAGSTAARELRTSSPL